METTKRDTFSENRIAKTIHNTLFTIFIIFLIAAGVNDHKNFDTIMMLLYILTINSMTLLNIALWAALINREFHDFMQK